ncbi:NAD(P)-binding protein [Streptomyces coelicoflavus]|uniref:NAD(P)-binding protein n=1 Tax=Streptomyces coelicoflavus TaxID=285562 RepID=UPI00367CF527
MTTSPRPPRRILIVGAGLAGASAAAGLREQGFDGDVTLFGREGHTPYELPSRDRTDRPGPGRVVDDAGDT